MKINNFRDVKVCPLCLSKESSFVAKQKDVKVYLTAYKVFSIEVPDKFKERELRRCCKCGQHFWNQIAMLCDLPSFADSGAFFYDNSQRIQRLLEVCLSVNKENLKNGFSVLDIGSYDFNFLNEFKKNRTNSKCMGVDPAPVRLEFINPDIDVVKSFFDSKTNLKKNKFDLITSFDCLEHVPNLGEFITKVEESLNSDGLFIFFTPNVSNPFNKLIGYRNMSLFWLEHITFMNNESLKFVINNYGFEVVFIKRVNHLLCNTPKSYLSFFKTFLNRLLTSNDADIFELSIPDHLLVCLRKK